jgi:hypothetical protein
MLGIKLWPPGVGVRARPAPTRAEPEQVVTSFADYPYEAYDELNDR